MTIINIFIIFAIGSVFVHESLKFYRFLVNILFSMKTKIKKKDLIDFLAKYDNFKFHPHGLKVAHSTCVKSTCLLTLTME